LRSFTSKSENDLDIPVNHPLFFKMDKRKEAEERFSADLDVGSDTTDSSAISECGEKKEVSSDEEKNTIENRRRVVPQKGRKLVRGMSVQKLTKKNKNKPKRKTVTRMYPVYVNNRNEPIGRPDDNQWTLGQRVVVLSGTYNGHFGIIASGKKKYPCTKKKVYIRLDEQGPRDEPKLLDKLSVQFVDDEWINEQDDPDEIKRILDQGGNASQRERLSVLFSQMKVLFNQAQAILEEI
jgi:hypothetical protein